MSKPACADEPCPNALGALGARYRQVRAQSERLCQPLALEDYGVQSMADVSPPKWHLAHVSWFFEAFLLRPFLAGYRALDERYDHLFNSYYQSHGTPFPRAQRGVLSRPTVAQVYRYREHVDQSMAALLARPPAAQAAEILRRVELGLQHEQQHQELLLMDIKHILAQNPMLPAYRDDLDVAAAQPAVPLRWQRYPGGIGPVGHDEAGFAFDCERPRHRVYVEDYQLASRPVSNAEYAEFIADGGYGRSDCWLADGWELIQRAAWQAPLYWRREDGGWSEMTLGGLRELDPQAPVCHLSYYEAEAFAAWAGARLPSEAEWELAAQNAPVAGNFVEQDRLQPMAAPAPAREQGLGQLFGDVWEWTGSAYRPYPGFRALAGSLGEYNGKFMSGQMVLRGGCCATPQAHVRSSYRNFFYPAMRWQFSGLRLAREA
ncbi:ergothioneine biosynthesis protein EgtB [Pseudomonas lalucatii]|uniref:Ergothioneine biosynthesis protein EgtB n=1 Tax=Pseudomonas lalucatii TaxID=1424203 RepID=A0ABS5Q578_9PSED|nr:ergothioneine biosynthesis protein EgtB [Pseudomonas lalucatii]MBS7663740.1 ergothioneine biosynthesis protein EgtB [Pseudomonas lalucatii]